MTKAVEHVKSEDAAACHFTILYSFVSVKYKSQLLCMCYRVSTIMPRLESSIVYLECSFDSFLLICTVLLLRVRLPASPPFLCSLCMCYPFYLISMGLQYNHHRITRVHSDISLHKDKGNLGASDTLAPSSSSQLKILCHHCLKYNFLRVVTKS